MTRSSLAWILRSPPAEPDSKVLAAATEAAGAYRESFESRKFHLAAEKILGLLTATDVFINDRAPWKLAKQPEARRELEEVLYTGLEVVRVAAVLLSPVMPKTAASILEYLGETRPVDGSVPFDELVAWGGLNAGHTIGDVPRTFPRIDEKKLKQVMAEAQVAAPAAASEPEMEPIGEEITIDDFAKLDLRVGVVREAGLVEGAKKLIRLMVDIGEDKPRQVFAGIRSAYPEPDELVGQQVVFVANLKPRKMKFGLSEGMVLAGHSPDSKRMSAATFDRDLKPGDKVT